MAAYSQIYTTFHIQKYSIIHPAKILIKKLVVWRFLLLKIGSVSVRFLHKNVLIGFSFFFVVTCDDTAIQVFTQVVSARVSVHLIWARKLPCLAVAGWCVCVRLLTVTPWQARRAVGWVSEWASLRYVRTSDPSVSEADIDPDFFGSADWQLILETRYNMLHYNVNLVI